MGIRLTKLSSRIYWAPSDDGFRAEIESFKQPYIIALVPAFLVLWALGLLGVGFAFLGSLVRGDVQPFIVVWLLGWGGLGGFMLYALAWALFGKEVLELRGGVLSIRREVLGRGRARRYRGADVRDLRAAPPREPFPFTERDNMDYWGFGEGVMAFEYRGETVRFGTRLGLAEAREFVGRIGGYFPSGG